jgi:hypothetical protein
MLRFLIGLAILPFAMIGLILAIYILMIVVDPSIAHAADYLQNHKLEPWNPQSGVKIYNAPKPYIPSYTTPTPAPRHELSPLITKHNSFFGYTEYCDATGCSSPVWDRGDTTNDEED